MTNTELVRQLRTASVQADDMRLRDFGYLMKTAAEKIDELLDIISNLRTLTDMLKETVPQWISVKERLPEEYTRVIGFMAWKAMTAIEYQNGKWYSFDHLSPLPNEAVTHWMPLPEPPKGEDK